MGLLLAFSVSGLLQRFDERRQLILQEANAISTANDRLDLFESQTIPRLKAKLKDYVQARIEHYHERLDLSLSNFSAGYSNEQQARLLVLKTALWGEAVAACPPSSGATTACALFLPSLNSVFDVARLRGDVNERHPPMVIFVMLFGLGLAGSLSAGFGMASAKTRSWVHMVAFALALATALFLITDIEFPRLGFIHVDAFDHFIADVHAQMR